MIPDKETNFLFLADTLKKNKYAAFLSRFEKALKHNAVPFAYLPKTKDIWAVDYMPVQTDNNSFLQFKYNPDYLQSKKQIRTVTDVSRVCKTIDIHPKKSDLTVDGGNVVRSKDSVIMCDKVFKENPKVKEKILIDRLKRDLGADKLFFVPQDRHDITGHADGMVRFIDDETVLINDYSKEDPAFQTSFRMSLRNAGLELVELAYNPYSNKPYTSAEGIYLNFLQMEQVIFAPIFNRKEDAQAVKTLERVFSDQKIVPVESNEIAKEGGVLNCITWNVKFKAAKAPRKGNV